MNPELQPEIILGAYIEGVFPMADADGELAWLSPDPRALIPLDAFRASKNLLRRYRSGKFTVTINRDFRGVMQHCAQRSEGTWISPDIIDAYTRLHTMGFAHSVETRLDDRLVGGLYGLAIGGAFFGESMFHRATDASKIALVHLVHRMRERDYCLLDVQFQTPHLALFGAIEVSRRDYLRRLKIALSRTCVFAD